MCNRAQTRFYNFHWCSQLYFRIFFVSNVLSSQCILAERDSWSWYGEFPRKAMEQSYTVNFFILLEIYDIILFFLPPTQPRPHICWNVFMNNFLGTCRHYDVHIPNKHIALRKYHANGTISVGLCTYAQSRCCAFFHIALSTYCIQSIRILFGRILWISLFDIALKNPLNLNAATSDDVVGETYCLYYIFWFFFFVVIIIDEKTISTNFILSIHCNIYEKDTERNEFRIDHHHLPRFIFAYD